MIKVVRALIETQSPLHIGSGREDDQTDADVIRDMNGLPTIPGTSLAGRLRSVLTAKKGQEAADRCFGFQLGADGQGSRLQVSFGVIVDAHGRPVEGLATRSDDSVLQLARRGVVRQHVRLDEYGVADAEGHGCFNERAVPSGTRFWFELQLLVDSEVKDPEALIADFEDLVRALADLRLGGRTRSGFGRIALVRWLRGDFDLSQRSGFEAYRALPVRFSEPCASLIEQPCLAAGESLQATLQLTAQSPWAIGGGTTQQGEDIAIYREPFISWQGDVGQVQEERFLVPATALKGVLAHRVAWHHNRLNKCFAGQGQALTGSENPAVKELFGFAKDRSDSGKDEARPGRLVIEDGVVSNAEATHIVVHNGLDRFTGGTRPGVLFSERLLPRDSGFTTTLRVEDPQQLSDNARQALQCALKDLERGQLQLGQGYGRGNGWFRATINWSDAGAWLAGGSS